MPLETVISDELVQFHPSYRQVEWDKLLKQANSSLDIMVYYWDKWVDQHQLALAEFLQKPKAHMRFVFSNQFEEVNRLFPGHSVGEIADKIKRTYKPLQDFLKEKRLPLNKVSAFFIPTLLNYSLQCVDERILVLSFFEMHRQVQVDSPALVIDLEKSPHLRKFYQKEWKGTLNQVSPISLL